jgi:O-antigen/teichoic acid export membrane protein
VQQPPDTAQQAVESALDAPAAPMPAFAMRGVGRHTLIYGLGIVLSRSISLLMMPVYTRFLTPADYGVMALIEMTLDLVSIVAGAQLVVGIFRYYHKTESESEREAVVSTSFFALAASYALVGFIAFLAAEPLARLLFPTGEHAGLIRIAAGSLAFQSLTMVPLAYARVQDRSGLFVAATLTRLLLSVVLAVLFLVVMGMGVRGVFLATLFTNILIGTVLSIWIVRKVGVNLAPDSVRDLFRYGLPLMVTQVASFVLTFADRFFLQRAADETAVGLYNLGYQFGFLLQIVGFTPFDMVWGPKRFEIAKRADRDEILSRGFRYLNVGLITVAVGISLYVGDVLRIMATPPFFSAANIVHIILVAYILQCWTIAQDIGILVSERTKFVTYASWTAAAAALILYALLIPPYGAWGAAVATVLAFMVRYGMTYYYSQRLFPIRYEWGPILQLVALGLAAAGAGLLLPNIPVFPSLLVRTVIVALYLAVLWKSTILTADERKAMVSMGRGAIEAARRRSA